MIVITGAAGFIGSCLLKYLNEQGETRLIAVDDLGTDERWKNLVGKKFLDLLTIDQLPSWLQANQSEVKAIVHLGACSSTTERNAAYLLENNYRYTIKLAEAALKHDIRFIYASSAATYGDGALGFSDHHDQLDELQPLNMYGYSKHLVDLWMKQQGVLDQVVGLKYFNVYGPNETHKGRMASVITTMVPNVQKEGKIRLFRSSEPNRFADGDQCRDFIYVKDVVKMTSAFLHNKDGGIFNVGTGVPSTWNSLAGAVFKALSKPATIEYMDMPSDLVGKYQDYTCAETKKLKRALGDHALCGSLKQHVGDYIINYLVPGKLW